MKVKFRTNLGSQDAKQFSLDHTDCTVGETVNVSDSVGEALVSSGVAEAVATVKAVAEKPIIAAPVKPAIASTEK